MKNHLVVVAVLAACGPKTPVAAAPVPAPVEAAVEVAAEASAEAEMLPPQFDADALRAGLVQGTVIRYRMSAEFQEGAWVEEWTVTAADDTGCTLHTRKFGPDGVTVVEEDDHTQTWAELSRHGAYPAATTTRTESSIDVAGQHLATVYYEQLGIDAEGTNVRTHFSPAHVGPPVWTQMSVGDDVIFEMELLSYAAP